MKRFHGVLSVVLAAAIALFLLYLIRVHNNLDTTGPVISVSEELLEISVTDPESALLQGVTAMDDRDGDVTSSLLVEHVFGIDSEGIVTVTYAAFDSSGNVSKLQRKICYADYRPPRFELYDSMCFPAGSGFDLLDHVGANDVIDGDIRRRVRATPVSDSGFFDSAGTHMVRLQVTNSLGDTATVDIPVEVYDPHWYRADVVLEEYLVYLETGAVFAPEDYLKSFVIRGETVDVSSSIPREISCSITDPVHTDLPGVYQVRYVLSQTIGTIPDTGLAVLTVVVLE